MSSFHIDMIAHMLAKFSSIRNHNSNARAVANIAMVKKDKARRIEDMLITQAQRGAIQGALDEEQLIQMLESISEMEGKSKGKVTMQRRRMDDDDDW